MRTYGKDTKRIHVRSGEHFVVELSAMATAGFEWVLQRDESGVTVPLGEEIARAHPGVGGSSIQRFEFAAARAGTTTLVMEYQQPWETETTERLEIDVDVEP